MEVADIRDSKTLLSILDTHKPDGVFHFSGLIEVGESVRHPDRFYDNNVAGSISLLNTMKEAGCWNIVFSSTCATYGIPDVQPIPEGTPQNPLNPYGHSKLMVETILRDYAECFGLNVVLLQCEWSRPGWGDRRGS